MTDDRMLRSDIVYLMSVSVRSAVISGHRTENTDVYTDWHCLVRPAARIAWHGHGSVFSGGKEKGFWPKIPQLHMETL